MANPSSSAGGYYPPVGFYFNLGFPATIGKNDAAFQEVSGIEMSLETEPLTEGGENRFTWSLPGTPKYSNLVLKRGLMLLDSPLRDWCWECLQGAYVKPIKPKIIQLSLLNESGQPTMVWKFYKAYPVKWQVTDLHSEKNEIVIESLEFAYAYFETND